MTGAEAVAALEGIGARLALRPDGLIDVKGPDVPDFDPLLDELRQHRDEAITLLRSRPEAGNVFVLDEAELLRRRVLRRERTLRDLASRYCGTCRRSWWRVSPRGDASCVFCERDARKLRATPPQAARTPTGPGSAIPPEANRPGGAA